LRHARGDRDGNSEDVIHQERSPGDESWYFTKIIARDDIRASAAGVGVYGLLVGDREDDQQADDGQGDGKRYSEYACACQDQHDQNFVNGIRARRKGI
jgi:hypothetical protein